MTKPRYKSNEKHRHPWQSGRKGSLCPASIDIGQAQALLDSSVLFEGHRYAASDGVAFKGQGQSEVWHGYPVGWMEVPETVRREMVVRGLVKRHDINRHWRN